MPEFEIITSACNRDMQKNEERNPLMIGCSGGGGHIAAINGIIGYLEDDAKLTLNKYTPKERSATDSSLAQQQIKTGMQLLHAPVIGSPIRAAVALSPYPVLPEEKDINDEVKRLLSTQKRQYIDMLLDVYPAGYESAAIWNVLQRNDRILELKKLVLLQHKSDSDNHDVVKQYFLDKLLDAKKAGKPFTEVFSTQAMALPALCDAVSEYNEYNKSEILIHQYMTDLPTKGALHFFNGLSTLTPEQQRQMNLYGVGMDKEVIEHFFPGEKHFAALINIPHDENPMVRPGFKNREWNRSNQFDETFTLELAGEKPREIKGNEQIASIMLGSQAGNDSYEYIESLLDRGVEKVFVFGGKTNTDLEKRIKDLISKKSSYEDRIIPLGHQEDRHIAPLMSRSNIVVIRGGGLSVMEQLAMEHSPEQTVLIHHANSDQVELSSGISWEDENVNKLIENLTEKHVHCKKKSPERARRDIEEVRLLAAYDESTDIDRAEAFQRIKCLSDEEVYNALHGSREVTLDSLFQEQDKKASEKIRPLIEKLTLAITALDNIILPRDKDATDEAAAAMSDREQIKQLLDILQNEDGSPSYKKLMKFRAEFEHLDVKTSLYNNGNIIKRIIDEISYFLSEFFYSPFKLTPINEVRKCLGELKTEARMSTTPKRTSFFAFFNQTFAYTEELDGSKNSTTQLAESVASRL